VRSRVGSDVLTRLCYSGKSPKSINYSDLPSRFVLKATHGSGPELRALIWDKSAISKRELLGMASRMLRRRCGPEVNEWWYTKIPSGVLIEEMLLEDGKIPADFKFYVFDGVALYVQVIEGRYEGEARGCFYDPKWRMQPFVRASFTGECNVAKPRNFNAMIAVAEALAAGLDFVRVDLYSLGKRIVFGEMTLAPGAGWVPFLPAAYDLILGQHWPDTSPSRITTTTWPGHRKVQNNTVKSTHRGAHNR
jgi:TupA-like ATPgrasp